MSSRLEPNLSRKSGGTCFRLEIWTETDQAAIFYARRLLCRAAAPRRRLQRLLFSFKLLGVVNRVNGLALPAQSHSSAKVSYAATVSFPASSFVLEARQQRQFYRDQLNLSADGRERKEREALRSTM